jgi:hypothetical protein
MTLHFNSNVVTDAKGNFKASGFRTLGSPFHPLLILFCGAPIECLRTINQYLCMIERADNKLAPDRLELINNGFPTVVFIPLLAFFNPYYSRSFGILDTLYSIVQV